MNNIHGYQDKIDNLPDSGGLRHVENYSGSTSSAYDEVSPHMHNSTPGSSESIYDKHNQSVISSKKSKNSHQSHDDNNNNNLNLTVDALEKTLTEEKSNKVKEIISQIVNLSDSEKLLLQLQFPMTEIDNGTLDSSVMINGGFNMSVDMLGNSTIVEQEEASKWVLSHLEENKSTCLQKQEVYEDYKSYCMTYNIKCLSTADFGKVMKKNFPNIKARRLGARGQSRYCYSGLRNRQETQSPALKDIGLVLEGNDTTNDDYRRRDNIANSEVESYSSTSVLNNDLSNVPEYELSPNILIDSALLIIEFIKQVAMNKNIMSMKQAVMHLLSNNQVDLRSPHALRLCSFFQQNDGQKFYPVNKYSTDQVFNSIKKEETLVSPCSVTPQRSSTASPQNQKRRDIFSSPVPNKTTYCDLPKPQSDNSPINTPQTINNSRSNYTCNQPYYHLHPSMLQMSHTMPLNPMRSDMSPASGLSNGTQHKSFVHSTPAKNLSNIEIPHLNSPLLDNNPQTSKKLEFQKYYSNLNNNNSSNLSGLQEKSPYYNTCDRSRLYTSSATYSNQESRRPNPDYQSLIYERNTSSPVGQNLNFTHSPIPEIEDIESCRTPLFNLDTRIDTNCQVSPIPSSSSKKYPMDSSLYGLVQSSMKNNELYLDTPGNSPNRNDSDKNNPYISPEESSSFYPISSVKREDLIPAPSYGPLINNYASYSNLSQHFLLNRSNDETNVTSTTSMGIIDPDGHPSTTMRQNCIYNK